MSRRIGGVSWALRWVWSAITRRWWLAIMVGFLGFVPFAVVTLGISFGFVSPLPWLGSIIVSVLTVTCLAVGFAVMVTAARRLVERGRSLEEQIAETEERSEELKVALREAVQELKLMRVRGGGPRIE